MMDSVLLMHLTETRKRDKELRLSMENVDLPMGGSISALWGSVSLPVGGNPQRGHRSGVLHI